MQRSGVESLRFHLAEAAHSMDKGGLRKEPYPFQFDQLWALFVR